MGLQHLNVKIFVDGELSVDLARLIELFHQWVEHQARDGTMIDVADYRHVPEGPGVILIGLEADYSLDHAGGRWGLLYNRKGGLAGSDEDRVRSALQHAAETCLLLEREFGEQGLAFSRTELELIVNDRALAPNTAETWEAARPQLQSALQAALGHDEFTMDHQADPRSRFSVSVRCERPFELESLAARTA